MRNDPIVAEVRAIRDELAAQCGYDIKEIFRKLREQQAKSGLRYVCATRPVEWIQPKTCEHPTQIEKPDEGVSGVRIG